MPSAAVVIGALRVKHRLFWAFIGHIWSRAHFSVTQLEQGFLTVVALDKIQFVVQKYWHFPYFFMKTYVVGTH